MQQHVFAISNSCASQGIKHVVICPGSRSAPLVYAFTQNSAFTCISVIDERSAGYIALGIAQQTKNPVVLICTSGTAALNLYPAIAEALYQKVPLVVLTADRPSELLGQQDGQMINQNLVFEKNCLRSEVLPSYQFGKENLKNTAQLVVKSVQYAKNYQGPVHINIPLREPLYPSKLQKAASPQLNSEENDGKLQPINNASFTHSFVTSVNENWNKYSRKIILIGQYPLDNELYTALQLWSSRNDVVIISDVLSNKQSVVTASFFDFILSHTDSKTLDLLKPELLISFGGPLVSKSLKLWLKSIQPKVHYRIQQDEQLVNTYGNVTEFVKCKPEEILYLLHSTEHDEVSIAYKKLWELLDASAKTEISNFINQHSFSEIAAVANILKTIPDAVNLHIANSSVVRYVSLLGELNPSWLLNGNRGTSGIDGCTSTAVGASIVNNRMTVLLTGDVGFLYDKNAFWNNYISDNLRIIVINNNGGGIFTLIDGPSQHPNQEVYFTTPHNGSIRNTALDNGLEYYFCDSKTGFDIALKTFFNAQNKSAVLEVKVNMKENAALFKRFKKIKI